jgi:hypothetical protein
MSDKVYYENKSITDSYPNDDIKIIDKPFDRTLLFCHIEKPTHLFKKNVKLIIYHLNGQTHKNIVNHDSIFFQHDVNIFECTTAIRNVPIKLHKVQDFICKSGVLYVFYYTNNRPIAYFVSGSFKDIEKNIENRIGGFNKNDEANSKYELIRCGYDLDDMIFK